MKKFFLVVPVVILLVLLFTRIDISANFESSAIAKDINNNITTNIEKSDSIVLTNSPDSDISYLVVYSSFYPERVYKGAIPLDQKYNSIGFYEDEIYLSPLDSDTYYLFNTDNNEITNQSMSEPNYQPYGAGGDAYNVFLGDYYFTVSPVTTFKVDDKTYYNDTGLVLNIPEDAIPPIPDVNSKIQRAVNKNNSDIIVGEDYSYFIFNTENGSNSYLATYKQDLHSITFEAITMLDGIYTDVSYINSKLYLLKDDGSVYTYEDNIITPSSDEFISKNYEVIPFINNKQLHISSSTEQIGYVFEESPAFNIDNSLYQITAADLNMK